MRLSVVIFLGMLFCLACQGPQHEKNLLNKQWVDLSYTFDSSTLYWPNNKTAFGHQTDAEGMTPLGYYYSSYSLCTPEHGGTHLDAPIHFAADRLTVEAIPLDNLIGQAVVVDVSARALADRDYLVTRKDFEDWEQKNGKIPEGTIILVRTGYGKFYPDRSRYFGTAKIGDAAIPELHFPGIHPDAARWLVESRRVKSLGLDTPSLDHGQSRDFKTHQVLLGNNVPGFENVANLDKLPETGVFVVALPMKVGKGSGAPLRIVATTLP